MSGYSIAYDAVRREVVSEWKQGERRCSVRYCINIPGMDGYPIQVDHVLDRNTFPELRLEKRFLRVTCGAHNEIDRTEKGKTSVIRRLTYIERYWGIQTRKEAEKEYARRGFLERPS